MIKVFLLYALSGFVGLGYQVVWFRFFTDWFGSTNLTFALVVCNFIGGLGAGGLLSRPLTAWIERRLRITDRLRVYGFIELVIAACAGLTALFPLLPADLWGAFPYHLADGIWVQDAGYRISQVAIGAALVFLPCLFMGATFPLICNAFVAAPGGARFPAALYAWNTLGACAGILTCQFVLLPAFGHGVTYWVAMALNLAVGVVFLIIGGAPATDAARPDDSAGGAPGKKRQLIAPLPVAVPGGVLLTSAVLSGLLSGALEGDMFKRLGFFIVSNPGALMPLISFWAVLGIFIASLMIRIGPRFTLNHIKIAYVLAFTYYFAASRLLYPAMNGLEREIAMRNPVISVISGASFFPESSLQLFLFTGSVVFIPYLLVSMLLPYVCNRVQAEHRHLGVAYGLNTLSFCTGLLTFTLIAPLVNIFYSLKLMMVLAACGLLALLLLSERRPLSFWQPLVALGAFAAGCVVTPAGFDRSYMNPLFDPASKPVVALKSNGANTTFVIKDPGYSRLYFGNLSMSGTNLQSQTYMRLMAHFPLLAQAAPRSALLICFGVGNTASAIATHDSIQSIDIVDLNTRVFETAPEFAASNQRVYADPRVRLINDDGRGFLRLTDRKYDLITSEPPPPMVAGSYRLYSREYYRDVLAHLTPAGIMSQWLPIYQMPDEAVKLAIRTFIEVFPHALLYVGFDMDLILVGSSAPIDEVSVWRRAGESPRVAADLRAIGIRTPVALLARVMRTDESLRAKYADGPVISDLHNDLEHLYMGPELFAVVGYDPREIVQGLRAQSADIAAAVEPVVMHLGRLRNAVPGFPLIGVARDPSIRLADADWFTQTHLDRLAARASRAGDRARALTLVRESLRLAPEQPAKLLTLADDLADRGQIADAERQMQEYTRIEPDDPRAYQARALFLMRLRRGDEAVAVLRRALALQPDSVQTLNNTAWILATHPDKSVRQPAEAIALARRAAELSGYRDPVALDTLAAALAASGRLSEAGDLSGQAATLAEQAGERGFGAAIRARQAAYRQGHPFIDARL